MFILIICLIDEYVDRESELKCHRADREVVVEAADQDVAETIAVDVEEDIGKFTQFIR